MRLIIAEKPSMARDIAQVVGAKQKKSDRWEGPEVWVSWCFGHLATIAPPDEHDPRWKRWAPDVLPIIPSQIIWKVQPKVSAHFRSLKSMIQSRKVTEIVNACDAGREGELIFRAMYMLAHGRKPVLRLWVSSLTKAALKKGFQQLRPSADFDTLGAAAYCRAEADWLVGMNGTRALTARSDQLLSLGRVQTPTLAMLVKREEEIEQFIPETYWIIEVNNLHLSSARGAEEIRWISRWKKSTPDSQMPPLHTTALVKSIGTQTQEVKSGRVYQKQWADLLAQKTYGQHGIITHVDYKKEEIPPPQLFHLTALQQKANQRFGYSAEQTLNYAQQLYERHKVLSYPRTDSRHLTPDLVPFVPQILTAFPTALHQDVQLVMQRGLIRLGKRYVNAQKVTDHHAIIPTTKKPDWSKLSEGERNIYELIARSLLAAVSPHAIDAITVIESNIIGELWEAKGRVCLALGWRSVSPPSKVSKNEVSLPKLNIGDQLIADSTRVIERQTKAPSPYNEATLLGAMERAGNQLNEASLKAVMRGSGIGTPATRASIIEVLIKRLLIERNKKQLTPTPIGRALINAIGSQALSSPKLTAEWELTLQRITDGQYSPDAFNQEIRSWVVQETKRLLAINYFKVSHLLPQSNKRSRTKTYKTSQRTSTVSQMDKMQRGSSAAQKASSPIKQTRRKTPEVVTGLTCPLCKQGKIITGKRGWGCDQWASGCKFVIWFIIQGIHIPEPEAARLVYRGQSRLFHEDQDSKYRLTLNISTPPFYYWEKNKSKKKKRNKSKSQRSTRMKTTSAKNTNPSSNANRWKNKR